jgi:hypothetical protein
MRELVEYYRNLLNEIVTAAELPSKVVPVYKKTKVAGKSVLKHVEDKPMGLIPSKTTPGVSRAEELLKHQQTRIAKILRNTPIYKFKSPNAAERIEAIAQALNMQVQRQAGTDITPSEPVLPYRKSGVPIKVGEKPEEGDVAYIPSKRKEVPIAVGGISPEQQTQAAERVKALRGKKIQQRRVTMTPAKMAMAKMAKGIEGSV